MTLVDYVQRVSRSRLLLGGIAMLAAIGYFDYITGPEYAFSIFYLLPLAAVAWFAGRRHALVLSFLAAVTWLVAELSWGHEFTSIAVPFWNAGVRLLFFIIVSLLISTVKYQHETLEQEVNAKTADIVRLNRVYSVLSEVNQAIIRFGEEKDLFDRVCRTATEKGKFAMAWIGLVDESTGRVRMTSLSGNNDGYVETLDLSLAGASSGASPITAAIQTGRYFVANDIARDKRSLPWREDALARSYRSCGSFPLKREGKCIGAFSFYSPEPGFFDKQEIALLDEMATDVSFFLDLTEREKRRRETEEALRRSEDRFRTVIESVRDIIYVISPNGVITSLNPSFEQLTGWRADDWIGKSLTDLVHPSDMIRLRQYFETSFNQRVSIPFIDVRFKTRGGSYRVCEANASPLIKEGRVEGVIGTVRDVTARVELEDRVKQSQKLESIGVLAGGVAHDFNNILNIILGHATMLAESGQHPDRLKRSVDSIMKATGRGTSLVKQLLTFARKSEPSIEPLQLNSIVTEITRLTRETFPRIISVETQLDHELPLIVADATQLHQVLLNLCINARDAMPKGGTLSIATGQTSGDELRAKYPEAQANRYVTLRVEDTGTGMDHATRQRIFEPFFTTKDVGKGTGLGLAVAFGIIENHKGFIEVQSEVGNGTRFTIYLPAETAHGIAATDELVAQSHTAGSETVLLVEDEDELLTLLSEYLAVRGYNVLCAGDGRRAVEMYAEHMHKIDVVVTDLGLPGMGGEDVCRNILAVNPAAKLILASGFIDPDMRASFTAAGIIRFVQKPYLPGDVLSAIRESLDGRRG